MNDSEKFATWCHDVGVPIDADVVSTWDAGRIMGAEMAWRASRRAALEESAKVCESVANELLQPGDEAAVFGAVNCRDAIRALSAPAKEE